jgi:hypothetical protein
VSVQSRFSVVRFGSLAGILRCETDVRFTAESDSFRAEARADDADGHVTVLYS